jgi:hypothetical protein
VPASKKQEKVNDDFYLYLGRFVDQFFDRDLR